MRNPGKAWCQGVVALSAVLGFWAAAPLAEAVRVDPKTLVTLGGEIAQPSPNKSLVQVHVTIAEGYHVNAHVPTERWLIATELTLVQEGITFANFSYPEPHGIEFAFADGKELLVYEGAFTITAEASPATAGPISAKLRYQACDDTNCFRPTTIEAKLGNEARAAGPPTGGAASGGFTDPTWFENWLGGASLPARLGMVFLLGLGLNLTPCVYPLISVTLGYFGGQTATKVSTFPLSVAYVVGITLSFAILGTSASLAGGLFGAPLQQPAVLVSLALVLLALAGSSFGIFDLRAPSALVNKLGAAQTGIGGALLMGLTMGIVAAPCIGPVVLGLLLYVGSEKDAMLGFALFSTMGLGMGLPYIALASAAGSIQKLPRAGEWLIWTNRVFGVLLVGMAYYFLRPLLSREVERFALPLLVIVGSTYIGFLEPSGRNIRGFLGVKRTFGTIGLALGIWLAFPSAPIAAGIRWQSLTPASLATAITEKRPAVVEFSAEWCLPCVEMEHSTFLDPGVNREAQRFAMLQADVTEDSAASDALLEEFRVAGVPTTIFYDQWGVEQERLVGFIDADRMLRSMQRIRPLQREEDELPGFREEGGGVIPAKSVKTAADHVVAQ